MKHHLKKILRNIKLKPVFKSVFVLLGDKPLPDNAKDGDTVIRITLDKD